MNHIYYFEIQADQPERAIQFYSNIFGWKFTKVEGMPVPYWQIITEGMPGGLLLRPAPTPAKESGTNAFTNSIQVTDFDAIAKQILDHGGTEALPKFAVPGRCWQGYFLDTEGNTFGIFEVDEQAA